MAERSRSRSRSPPRLALHMEECFDLSAEKYCGIPVVYDEDESESANDDLENVLGAGQEKKKRARLSVEPERDRERDQVRKQSARPVVAGGSVPPVLPALNGHDLLSRIAGQQQARGSYTLSAALAGAVGLLLEDLKKALREFIKHGDEEEEEEEDTTLSSLWATAVAVAFLQKNLPNLKNDWTLMVQKSTRWMERTLATLPPQKSHGPASGWLAQALKLF